jgi:hypothetical protein
LASYNNGNLSKAQVIDMQRGLNTAMGTKLAVDGKLGAATQGVLQGYRNNEAEKQYSRDMADMIGAEKGLASQQAPQQAVQTLFGRQLDQQATDDAWARWRSNDAPEGFIPSAVYK